MLKNLKPLLHYTKGEKRGIAVLLILILILLIIRVVLPYWFAGSQVNSIVIDSIAADSLSKPKINTDKEFVAEKSNPNPDYVCCVDPNTATLDELVNAGFSNFAANNIIRYRNTGAVFNNKQELFKIYGIDSNHKKLIENVIRIVPKQNFKDIESKPGVEERIIDINKADTLQLFRLPGIGRVLAKRIVKYRTVLGGFYTVNQLEEVYGVSDTLFRKILPYIAVESEPQKIDINTNSANQLMKHPYINKFQAQTIVKYKELTGNEITNKSIRDLNVFTELEIERLLPYLLLKDYNLD